MKRTYMSLLVLLFGTLFVGSVVIAQNDTIGNDETGEVLPPAELILETDDRSYGEAQDDIDTVEDFMITKEIEGTITQIGHNIITIMTEDEKTVALYVDEETLVYVNDEKGVLEDIDVGDAFFAYYIDENGIKNCDWIEVTK